MRSAITVGFRHGTGETVLVYGAATPPNVQRQKIRELGKKSDEHPEFFRIEVWESDGGRVVDRKFLDPRRPKPAVKTEEPVKAATTAPAPVADRFQIKK